MATSVKITQIGNSVGIILPKEVLSQLQVAKGDTLLITPTPDGVQLSPYEAEFANKIAVLEKVMRDNRDVLRKLAE
jgi:putative addiction module antidote